MDEPDLRSIGDRIEHLLDELHARSDRASVERAEELVRLVTELYGAGLARVVEIVGATDTDLLARLYDDALLASLLVVHDLHPEDLGTRVERALAEVRPLLGLHDGDIELVAIDAVEGVVTLKLLGSCDGCPSSTVTLQHTVEKALLEAAPELRRIDVTDDQPPGVRTAVALGRKPELDPATACGAGVA